MKFYFNKTIQIDKKVKTFIKNISNDFMENLENSIKNYFLSIEYDHPFEYRERTLTSFFFPALLSNSKGALMELGYKKTNTNFLDFYALDKNSTCSYLIEFKQCFWRKSNEKATANLTKKWKEVNQQIEKINKTCTKNYIDTEKTIYAISYLFIPILSPINRNNDETKKLVLDSVNQDLKNYDWMALYEVPKEPHDLTYNSDTKAKSKYSHVLLIGKIKKILNI